jgi:uncharacterized protein YdeI (YjbR/CyaY-like superfamily)
MMNPKVDFFFRESSKWQEAYIQLRNIVLDCNLVEELKWGCPCYTYKDKNIVLIHGFKDYCALLFMKGVLLKDPNGILIQQTEKVQVARQVRFTNAQQIKELAPVLKAYIYDAVEIEESGKQVTKKTTAEYEMVDEFRCKLDTDAKLKAAFYSLTPGRQRGYLYHFSQPKTTKTREARVAACTPKILDGKGLED